LASIVCNMAPAVVTCTPMAVTETFVLNGVLSLLLIENEV